jgi:thiamine biosynthesis lipoprotein ApbE
VNVLLAIVLSVGPPDAGPPVAEFVRGGKVVRAARKIGDTRVAMAIADAPAEGMADHERDFEEAFVAFDQLVRQGDASREGSAAAKVLAAAGGEAVTLSSDGCELFRAAIIAEKRAPGVYEPLIHLEDGGLRATLQELVVKGLPTTKDDATCTVRLARAGAQLELGQLAYAVAIDRLVKVWRAKGYKDFSIDAGALKYFAGAVGDRPWQIDLNGVNKKVGQLQVENAALAMSYEAGHGAVIVETRSVAESFALALVALGEGPGSGLKSLAAAGAKGVFVDAKGIVKHSPELKAKITMVPVKDGGP